MIIYIWRLVKNDTIPNPATWLITVVLMTINTLTYSVVVEGKIEEATLSILVLIGVVIIFFYSLANQKFAKPELVDFIVLGLAAIIVALWKMTANTALANVALQSVFLISIVPMVYGLVKGSLRDHPLPWALAVVSYLFQIATILTDPDGWRWVELAFPILNGIVGNGTVAITIIRYKRIAPLNPD
ncbi:MAG: hypothetical protein HY461_02020 [Parcubacteria group bacterium]|nr:hypothetical protein [Parcubacteria group bacterium]